MQRNSIEKSKNTRILLGNCIWKFLDKSWNFLENLGISKIEKQNSLYNSRNLNEIFRKKFEKSKINFGNSKIFQKIPRFIQKFPNAIAKQNSGIFWFFNRVALQKLIFLYSRLNLFVIKLSHRSFENRHSNDFAIELTFHVNCHLLTKIYLSN